MLLMLVFSPTSWCFHQHPGVITNTMVLSPSACCWCYHQQLGVLTISHYFYQNFSLETIHSPLPVPGQRIAFMGCLAGIATQLPVICRLDSPALAGNHCNQSQKVFWLHLYHDVCLERHHHLVDLECIGTRGCSGFPGQLPADVFALAGI